MSKDQQAKQIVIFSPAPPPLPRVVPSQTQIESWKNSKIYGLWINNKRVSNSELNKYQNTDFAQVFVSKLGKNTVNYGKHYYQVDLMTTEHYETYYKQTIESKKKFYMGIRMGKKEGRVVEKGKLVS
jgi:bla regulator protein blaR1